MNSPYYYNFINEYNGFISPSTVHVKNTQLNSFFARYLLQKTISVFEWNIPENWDIEYLLYNLYITGYISVINTNKFGIIPQKCSLSGYNVYNKPNLVTINNPYFLEIKDLNIGSQCELIKLTPDFCGIYDIIDYYSNLLSLCSQTLSVNTLNSKVSWIFGADTPSIAESFKKMFDKVSSGEPAVVIDKQLMDNGKPNWNMFSNNLKDNYIAGNILEQIHTIEHEFDTLIGIPNIEEKNERLISSEVVSLMKQSSYMSDLWFRTIQNSLEKVNKLFNINVSVNTRKLDIVNEKKIERVEKNES